MPAYAANAAQERERSRLQGGEVPADVASAATAAAPSNTAPLDPRSYMAKSVPQRMAITSPAGPRT